MTTSSPSLADSLIQALYQAGQERLLDLVRNPLRLSMLCQTWNGSSLPDTQAQLYEDYLKRVYTWNRNLDILNDQATRCGTRITDLKKQLNQQLGELAKVALDLPQERFRLSQRLVEQYLGEEIDNQSLCYLALRLGWLNRVGVDAQGQPIFAFYHATFQEYFAALAVEDWDYFLPRNHVNFPVAGKEYRIFEPHWKQVILLWFGRDIVSEKKEEFIQALVQFRDESGHFYGYQAFFLAAAGINEFKTCSLASEIVKQLVKWGFGEFNIEKQQWGAFPDPIAEGARKAIPETIRQVAIIELVQIIENCQDEFTRELAAQSLGKIDPGNPQAISALLSIVETTEDEDTRRQAAQSLGEVGQGNPQAIAALLSIVEMTEGKLTRWQAAQSLGNIGQGNPQAISALLSIVETTEDEDTRRWAALSLGESGQGNPQAIAALLSIVETTEDELTRRLAAQSLGKIDPGNPQAISALLSIVETTENESIREWAAQSLEKIDPGNPQAISALLSIVETTEDEFTRELAAQSLGKIDPGNLQAISALLSIVETTEDEFTRRRVAENLGKILTTSQQYANVVSALEDCLSDDVYQGNFDRFDECYKVVWDCATNLPYPDFYHAWHGLTKTQTSPLIQTLNLAQLPQLLQSQLTETNLHQTLQLFCIDGSKFDNRDNPAADIYLQLIKKHHCPKSTEGTPRTLTELKIYWELLEWEKHPILIFYEEAKPQGFSQTFLDSLSRFDATICVISDSPHPTIPTFSPQDPHLIQTIMTWLQRTTLEA